ncbi:rhodanese-like domain-containing protein [Clostridium niameyense]|uniref:rhodanese-like domain-containing protein n=1 Tax=Clostridium niameyense TaxID=1622073 RepID=UPI00067F670B|nr:rhodanese-like domain-containing protein [Clostridium niameyense]
MKKKLISLLLAAIALFSFMLVGCGNTEEKKDAKNDQKQEQKQEDKKKEATKFNYIKADELKSKIEKKEPVIIVDIQVKDDFKKHHIKGAIETNAFPVKEDTDKAKLDKVMDKVKGSEDPVVIVCPRGKKGAERTYEYFKEKGIKEDRLLILENGQSGWKYDELLEK